MNKMLEEDKNLKYLHDISEHFSGEGRRNRNYTEPLLTPNGGESTEHQIWQDITQIPGGKKKRKTWLRREEKNRS
jgi:hypothetical protein